MAVKKMPVCPHCGSKDVKRIESFYRCGSCNTDFGREAKTDDGVSLVDAVQGVRFRYGDVLSGSVRIRFAQDGDSALYEVYDSNEGGRNKVAGVIDGEAWLELKKKLVENLFVPDWQKEYLPVNDGRTVSGNNAWHFSLIVDEDEEISSDGVDAFPVYWDALMKVLDPYFQQLQQD